MKNLILLTFAIFSVNCSSDSNSENLTELYEMDLLKTANLTNIEIEDLKYLREEEKLARDVYIYSYEKYNLPVFKNISNSENQHMSAVLNLLNTYEIEDSASTEIGKFNNPELQQLYDNLVKQCDISLVEALKVGNTIEDLDINDLALNELRTNNPAILAVYASLKCGSGNHLRSFNKQLIANGGSYTPSYITQEEFNTILNSSHGKCGMN